MKILLSGAAGFLGSHLSKKILENGHSVIGIDDLSTGSLTNLQDVINDSNFTFIKHDVREPFSEKVDAILNFACQGSRLATI